MDHFQYPDHQTRKQESKHKKRLTQDQVRLLESNFSFNNKLEADRKTQLAMELGVPPRQVAIWYQNKRARDKIQGLELEHRALQQRLEDVLLDNARLKDEVDRLKYQLHNLRAAFDSNTTSGEEVGSSNLERELYATLVGSGCGSGSGSGHPFDAYDFFG